jgi:DNA-binding LacI/PurR family transcriptional regulator
VSIREVAREASVSYQTVSRVINESANVKASTRETVLDVISRLGFRPNRAARALAGGPVQSVTVLTADTRRHGYAAALEGIEEASRAAGFAMGVRVVESGTQSAVRDAVERAIEPAGALIIIAYDPPGIAALDVIPPGVPMAAIVETPSGNEGAGKPWVWIDDGKSARSATEYLLTLGHQTVHYLSIPIWTASRTRAAGWQSALEDAGAPVPELIQGGWGPEFGYEIGERLARDNDVTAMLCGNDDLAMGFIRAMNKAGRAVPDDVSVVGIDDTPLAPYYNPPLTTVRQDFQVLGRMCFAKLLSVLGRETDKEVPSCLDTELVIRESAGPPKRSSRRAQSARRSALANGVPGPDPGRHHNEKEAITTTRKENRNKATTP